MTLICLVNSMICLYSQSFFMSVLLSLLSSEHITTCLANIHSYVLRDCRQMPWAGDLSPEITLSSVKQHEKKKEQLKVMNNKVPNLPYSKLILNERIR